MSDVVLKNVSFSYDKDIILDDINLNFTCKDFLAIIGPNGGGKSTLLKLMLGLLTPNSGEIKIFNQAPNHCKQTLAYVPQNTNNTQEFPITSLEVVLMGKLKKKLFSFYTKQDYEKAKQCLEKVGILHLQNEHINKLSGGQRQRVYIARALCADARLLLLDEPTASIDTNGQIQIYQLLKQLNDQIGIIMISHDINISVAFANKVAHVNKKLFLHDIENLQAKQQIINNLEQTNDHLCSVEILSKITCNDPQNCKGAK